MRLKINSDIESLLDIVRSELGPDRELFIVGGAVRDALLGRKLHDIDFTMAENPEGFAKRLAKQLKAGFFVLDDERHTARVVYRDSEGNKFPLDFVKFTGGSLLADLAKRDFTINAMAVPISNPMKVIDPLNGQGDLELGIIRQCTDRSLLDDPVRVLRSIRLALQLGFDYAPSLTEFMREAAVHLPKTSYERQRDEFFRILDGPDPSVGIEHCRRCGVFETLIPPLEAQESIPASPPHVLPLFDHSVAVVDRYDLILKQLQNNADAAEKTPWWMPDLISELGQFSADIQSYFSQEITPGRSKRGLTLLGALLHDIGKPPTMEMGQDDRLHYYNHAPVGSDMAWEAAKRLQLSNSESEWVRIIVQHHMWLVPLVNADVPPGRRSVYRFYNAVGEVGVAIALLSLADTLATYGETLSAHKWRKSLAVTKILLSAWWEHNDSVVSPEPLLDGDDLQDQFGLKPGKVIGKLLKSLLEAQASGEINTVEEASVFIREQLDDRPQN